MVDYRARAKRLRALREATGMAYEPFGRLAGVSGAAMHKACKTGRIDEKTADLLVAAVQRTFPTLKADLADLMYGPPTQRISTEADLDRSTALQILNNLPPQHRDTWMDIGHVMVQRYSDHGPGKPFSIAKGRLPAKAKS